MPPPRRPLGEIDGNSQKRAELSPYYRGRIAESHDLGSTWKEIKSKFKIPYTTAWDTVHQDPLRYEGESAKRSGRPKKWDARDERAILRYVHTKPHNTWTQIKADLALSIGKTTIQLILEKYHIKKWRAKKRPFLTEAHA